MGVLTSVWQAYSLLADNGIYIVNNFFGFLGWGCLIGLYRSKEKSSYLSAETVHISHSW